MLFAMRNEKLFDIQHMCHSNKLEDDTEIKTL